MLTLTGVAKTFPGGLAALSAIDLTIPPGAFLSLLGPSGCGKSTLLRLMAGLDQPTAGKIAGRPEGGVGLVFQDPTLMPWATVEDNVYLPLRLAGVVRAAARPRIAEALSLVGLTDFAQAYPRALSGGMRMRASIARAIVTRPQLLLMDEPFAALDEITRMRLNDDLLKLWRGQGFTCVFVTHSVFESVYLSTEIAVMSPRPGRIVARHEVAAPDDIAGQSGRDPSFRVSQTYLETCRAVSSSLEQAMAAAA